MTWGSGKGGTTGPITAQNSVLGQTLMGGESMNDSFNPVYGYLVVGRPAENIVTLFWPNGLFLPLVKKPS